MEANVPRFVSEAIEPSAGSFDPAVMSRGEPALPPSFRWRDAELAVGSLERTWRTTKVDRGDTYVKRHWFQFLTTDNRRATVYFERQARRGAPRWSLFSIESLT